MFIQRHPSRNRRAHFLRAETALRSNRRPRRHSGPKSYTPAKVRHPGRALCAGSAGALDALASAGGSPPTGLDCRIFDGRPTHPRLLTGIEQGGGGTTFDNTRSRLGAGVGREEQAQRRWWQPIIHPDSAVSPSHDARFRPPRWSQSDLAWRAQSAKGRRRQEAMRGTRATVTRGRWRRGRQLRSA